jgi:hypothetical protein
MDTNIVLLSLQLVMPAFNDFAEKAQLDLKLPLEMTRATKTNVGKNNRGVLMVFDDRYQFNWHSGTGYWGSVNFMDKQLATPSLDRATMLPWLVTQKSLIGTNEAVIIASNCLHRLGYDRPEWVLFPPTVTQYTFSPDPKTPQKPLPIFAIRWFPPHPPEGVESHAFMIEVYGLDRRITMINQLFVLEDSINLHRFTNLLKQDVRSPSPKTD